MRFDFVIQQPKCRAQHHAYLAVVTASVGCSSIRVGMGVLGDHQGVQFTDNGQPRTGACPEVHLALDAGDGESIGIGHAHRLELVLDDFGGTVLVETRLRVFKDVAGDADEFIPALVDNPARPAFKFLLGGHQDSSPAGVSLGASNPGRGWHQYLSYGVDQKAERLQRSSAEQVFLSGGGSENRTWPHTAIEGNIGCPH